MATRREQLRILYLQIRNDQVTRAEELQEFVRFSQLDLSQFMILNVFDSPCFAPQCVDAFDALFVGGSSDASVLQPQKYPFVEDAKRLLAYCVQQGVPVFASCFGFQLVVEALGGQVILDRDRMEMGVYPMHLNPQASEDLLLHDTPSSFMAVSGHQERALTLPQQTIALAYSQRCPYHALKVMGKPFYGFQFHPEVDCHDLVARITRYQERYLDSPEHLQRIVDSLVETPHANQLIAKFVDRILLGAQP
ncbi:type 1 glutamine amidotransferase [Synechococcales cyanobacterium C]|uniref:Type 1 glutamine amidotransferase n=1 Tax=Petrachloros mirabilis ULC683 TaxID=2781853 RepID=A0A8K2A1B1_9CYAN|nr:type 1 glutamine amidotransferase [Petrachloros mirabilis]NCJ07597.1 type 1 glutamine amidotransferase [Petrachloros mirabilis ULC683]